MTEKKIPILCPKCLVIGFGENLLQVCDIVRANWKLSLKFAGDEEKQVYRQLMGDVAVKMSPKRLGEILKNEGYLTMICGLCMAKISEEMYEKAGKQVVRIGAYVFEKKFYEANEDYIFEQLKNAPLNSG